MGLKDNEIAMTVNGVLWMHLAENNEWSVISNKVTKFANEFTAHGDTYTNFYGRTFNTGAFSGDLKARVNRLDAAVLNNQAAYPEMMMDFIKVYEALQVAVAFYGDNKEPDLAKGFGDTSLKAGELIGKSASVANTFETSNTQEKQTEYRNKMFASRAKPEDDQGQSKAPNGSKRSP
ncbi:hypothetical protein [Legionella sp. W05-934-2]|jgi:hypothetical protein|uniref:hypothetical protein n=1 Tax=Legionella sp. W05-934-2 TaxID=1198649 RepID=UPI0034632EF2